jgi:hypothetical protein
MPCASAATSCGAFPALFFAPRTVLPSIDHQPPAGLHRPGVQPGAEDPVERIGADQGERATVGGLLRRAAFRAERR